MRDDMPMSAVRVGGLYRDESGQVCARVRFNFRSPALLLWMARHLYAESVERGVPGWHPLLWWGIARACWFMFWGR